MLAARWLGLAAVDAQHFLAATASVGILGYEHNRAEPIVLLWNDVRENFVRIR